MRCCLRFGQTSILPVASGRSRRIIPSKNALSTCCSLKPRLRCFNRCMPIGSTNPTTCSLTGPTQRLFPNRTNSAPLKSLKTFWHSVTQTASLHDYRIHDNRHTHASHLVSSGMSLPIVGRLLGHTNPSTTQRYAHLADDPLRDAAEIMGRKLKAVPK